MNLLEYVNTPVRYELKMQPASLKIRQQHLKGSSQTNQGEFRIQQRHVKVRTDTVEMFNSLGFKTGLEITNDAAQRGKQAAAEATIAYSDIGNSLKNIHKGANIPDTLFSQYMQHSQGNLVLLPLSPTEISWTPGDVQMQYTPTEQSFRWEGAKTEMEFVPGSFSLDILQHPSISFRYLGEPIYVPPSAAPDA